MAHSTVILDRRTQKKDGTYPVKIRVSHKGEFYINTGIDIFLEQWIESGSNVRKAKSGTIINHKLADRYNAFITAMKLNIDRKLLELSETGVIYKTTNAKLKNMLSSNDDTEAYKLSTHYEKYLTGGLKKSTVSTYQLMKLYISKFTEWDTIIFEEITYTWLRDFDKYMISLKLSTNTRAIYMRNLKAIFNDAINCDHVSLAMYPFRKFKIQKEATMKRSLTVEQLRQLKNHECEPHQEKYRDLFMLIFYLCGINIVDLLNLEKIDNGRIEFKRSKTGRIYSIKLEPEAQEIIDKYRGENYLLNILDTYVDYKNFAHLMNNNLKRIGSVEMVPNNAKEDRHRKKNKKEYMGLFPELSTYWARHTWATIAAEINISDETISLALGHSGPNTTTNIYIRRNLHKVDEANRMVIDYLFGN